MPNPLDTLPLLASPRAWVDHVMQNFDAFLGDHASCEKKASGMALHIAAHYPDRPQLVSAMVDLAVEELMHYREVVRLILARDLSPTPDTKDAYVQDMNNCIRRGSENYLLDRLLVAAVIEARGHERFALLARALPQSAEKRFYTTIAASEERHWRIFYELALTHTAGGTTQVARRLDELIAAESDVIRGMPLRAALH